MAVTGSKLLDKYKYKQFMPKFGKKAKVLKKTNQAAGKDKIIDLALGTSQLV